MRLLRIVEIWLKVSNFGEHADAQKRDVGSVVVRQAAALQRLRSVDHSRCTHGMRRMPVDRDIEAITGQRLVCKLLLALATPVAPCRVEG